MVHVDLENLFLAQQTFDLERQQDFVNLARQCFLGGEIEIARHLHRDRRRALRIAGLAEIRQAGPNDADVIDAAVLVEPRIFGGEHRVLHHLRNLRDRQEVAALLAELAQHHAVGREDAHRQLRPVVGQAADLGEVGVRNRQRDADQQHAGEGQRSDGAEQTQHDARQRPNPRRRAAGRCLSCVALGFAHGSRQINVAL
jgi:hypothetical protein